MQHWWTPNKSLETHPSFKIPAITIHSTEVFDSATLASGALTPSLPHVAADGPMLDWRNVGRKDLHLSRNTPWTHAKGCHRQPYCTVILWNFDATISLRTSWQSQQVLASQNSFPKSQCLETHHRNRWCFVAGHPTHRLDDVGGERGCLKTWNPRKWWKSKWHCGVHTCLCVAYWNEVILKSEV